MKMEIERKFLVVGNEWRKIAAEGMLCEQGYLAASAGGVAVRVRRMDGRGILTIKGPSEGISRIEMEYDIPEADAADMIRDLCGGRTVSKIRYRVEFEGFVWDVDEFSGANAGLLLAEIELDRENQPFARPAWLGEEVSRDPRYFNAFLAENPYSQWDA